MTLFIVAVGKFSGSTTNTCTDTHTERRRKMKGQLNEKLIQFSTVFIVSRLCQLIIVVELLLVTGLRCCNT